MDCGVTGGGDFEMRGDRAWGGMLQSTKQIAVNALGIDGSSCGPRVIFYKHQTRVSDVHRTQYPPHYENAHDAFKLQRSGLSVQKWSL